MRRLLSLDYVIEHSALPWLPTEPEKVAAFEALGIERELLPSRLYRGAAGTPGAISRSSNAVGSRTLSQAVRSIPQVFLLQHDLACLGRVHKLPLVPSRTVLYHGVSVDM